MKKFHISGKEKTFPDTMPECKVCKGGSIFKDKPYRLDDIYPTTKEYICLDGCESKYIVERITPALPVNILSTKDFYESEIKALKMENELLTENNNPYFILKMADDYGEMVRMNPKVMELREQFNKMGSKLCPEHIWIESKPFKTFEGIFTIKNCAVCKEGQLLYKGITKYGTLTELVNFLMKQSLIFNEKAVKKGEMFSDMVLKGLDFFNIEARDVTATINEAIGLEIPKKELPKLFDDDKPKLIF